MSKRRGTTWYRQVNQEVETILSKTLIPTDGNYLNSEETLEIGENVSCSFSDDTFSEIEIDPTSDQGSDADVLLSSISDCDYFSSEESQFTTVDQVSISSFSCGSDMMDRSTETSVVDSLRQWAVVNKITHNALKGLLDILSLSTDINFSSLPKDPRSFLFTPKQTISRSIDPGHYSHIGIRKSLENQYKSLTLIPNGDITIGINIDGLPLAKSTSSQVYPILGINKSLPLKKNVFLIGLYHGYEKPKDFNEFLIDFVNEAKDLTSNGIILFGRTYKFKISMFLFDAVAKASVLFIKGHSGYHSCTKCTQEGEYMHDRVCFPDLEFTKRTHTDFILQVDSDHHTGRSILCEIPGIDLIQDIPLDYMHLICLGVVKKLVNGIWCSGSPPHKLSGFQIQSTSRDLINLARFIPSEFARRPRGLKEVKRWKATEFRQFLLYTGPVVLKNVLTKQKYQHFISLTVASRLLLTENLSEELTEYVESLLKYFLRIFKEMYGSELMSHNFHNLLHLVDDYRRFGSLENFSNFSSENFLHTILKMLRKHEKPLEQIIRRYHEFCQVAITAERETKFSLGRQHDSGVLVADCTSPQFESANFSKFKLSTSTRDSCCLLKNGSIVVIKNFAFCPVLSKYVVIGQEYNEKSDFFDVPCPSSFLKVYLVKNLREMLQYWPISEIEEKLVMLPFENEYVVFPLLHLN